MIVLSLPVQSARGTAEAPARYSVRQLLDAFAEPFPVVGVECAICGLQEQEGRAHFALEGPILEVVTMRINRFTAEDKSSDHVLLDFTLELQGVSYKLRAVLQHRGRSIHSGHYVTLLKTSVGWETRDEGVFRYHGDCVTPPVAPGDVYVFI